MILTRDKIIEDIQGEKFYYFLQEFNSLKKEITEINLKPSIAKSYRNIDRLKKHPNFRSKMQKFYGKDVIISLDPTPPPKMKIENKVFFVDDDEWEKWFLEFMAIPNRKINLFSYCYNSNKKQYVASVQYIGVNDAN